jgi:hypothetical protein
MNHIKFLSLLVLLSFAGCSDKAEAIGPSALLTAYPNPMSRSLNVVLNNTTGTPGQLVVFDPKGQIVADQAAGDGVHQFAFDVSSRPEGRYHVVFKAGAVNHTTEILKR